MVHTQQEYSQSAYQSPRPDSARLFTGLRQALSPNSQSNAVVQRNSENNSVSQGGEASIGIGRQSNIDGVLAGKDLYYMPMNSGSSRLEGPRPDMFNSPNMRGTKRSREVDAEDGDVSRKHGKRLTTKEEVSLFELCNRHADTFGKRSDICNWWKTIAAEFTRIHGRPYSWHSVRRKVEVVTKQRIKFIDDQRQRQRELSGPNPVQDLMNPQWCAVLDSWIPTWQRWEKAEAQRISKRDEMIRRRSHSRPQPDLGEDVGHTFQDDDTASPDVLPLTNHNPTTAPTLVPPQLEFPSSSISASVKLPPGFENMFSNNQSAMPVPSAPVPVPTSPSTGSGSDQAGNRMVSAVIETLGKLNKHLDAASGDGSTDARASPVISALVQAATESQTQNNSPIPADINRIKEELRQEMKAEMRRERAVLEERLDSLQRTQEMILEMLRQRSA
ncbi:uncharacterized protein N7477_009343 [Penicillium maclennaniae]|uniref:uncharacterized protein n=1 Tax=Penicillium maclennaniae TaxID=1343394 RepID=UPI002540F98A|nr:uncharacterized protein N7477_009343 [Penicillium maclennaniae]KAJ5661727.1 hypothetical protein N7477_009343 [Penicillium maclennaniae]